MSRHCRRRLLTRDFRTRDADHANSFADSAIASSGSKGLERPRQFAVAGINCATPCAPARLTADGSNRLSRQISRAKKSGRQIVLRCRRGKRGADGIGR
jgi:hypothetical protein